MKLLSPAISRLARWRMGSLAHWMDDPIAAQRAVLQDLITKAQYTEFGKQYRFSELFTIKHFKAAVPIHEYDQIKPYIERVMAGEQNVLWNTPIHWFAKSSGTTSDKSKFIPISEESLNDTHFQASKDLLTVYYQNYPQSDLLTGKGLMIGGAHQINKINEDNSLGDLSAVLLQNTPFWGQWLRTPELSIALLDDWEVKIEQLAQTTIAENVTSISGVPTWTLVLIKRILEITQQKTLQAVWPNLELYIHGGVSFTPYQEQFKALIGKPIHYLNVYNASEGFFAIQNTWDAPHEPTTDMLLLLNHGIFYEFMPLSEYGKPQPQTVGLDQVELHKQYALVITTNGGLWRYLIGDTIAFSSLHPFKIQVTGRLKHYINAFGEELIVNNADFAINQACTQTQAIVNNYTAGPVYFSEKTNGGHEWLVEFEKMPTAIEAFALALDQALKSVNSDYEAKRYKNIALAPPIVQPLPINSFNQWLKLKGKLGGQHKVPRLSNNRDYLDEIKKLFL